MMTEDERDDEVVDVLLAFAMKAAMKLVRGRFDSEINLVERPVQNLVPEMLLWRLPDHGTWPQRSRLPAEKL